MNTKEQLTKKSTPFLNTFKSTNKNSKIIFCGKEGENRGLKEDCARYFKEIDFGFMSPDTPHKWHSKMGICYNLFSYAHNDDKRGNTRKSQYWTMEQMRGNRD